MHMLLREPLWPPLQRWDIVILDEASQVCRHSDPPYLGTKTRRPACHIIVKSIAHQEHDHCLPSDAAHLALPGVECDVLNVQLQSEP